MLPHKLSRDHCSDALWDMTAYGARSDTSAFRYLISVMWSQRVHYYITMTCRGQRLTTTWFFCFNLDIYRHHNVNKTPRNCRHHNVKLGIESMYIKMNPYFPWSRHHARTAEPIALILFCCACYCQEKVLKKEKNKKIAWKIRKAKKT